MDGLVAQVGGFAPLTLAEVSAAAALQQRVDRKYVVPVDTLAQLVERLEGYSVLEIEGARTFTYATTYFDSESLLTYRAHVQRRRRRFKCRSRHYLESGLHQFEVKLKGRRGETVKERLDWPPDLHGVFAEPAQMFLRDCLLKHYGLEPAETMQPTLHMRYTRLTLASLDEAERLTVDVNLGFAGTNGVLSAMRPEYAIVESKSTRGRGGADRHLRALGFRPTACSKYCLGIALTRADVRRNEFLWLVRRYFQTVPVSPSATPQVPAAPAEAARDRLAS